MEKYDKLILLGDISLNNEYINLYNEKVNPFSGLNKYFDENSYIIGNLECLCEGFDGENELKKPRLKTAIDTLGFLQNISPNCVTLAHNHVYDNLLSGFYRTTSKLDELGIDFIGAVPKESYDQEYFFRILMIGAVKVGILNYVTLDTNPNLPDKCPIVLSIFNQEHAIGDIRRLKNKCDYIVLLMHWGGKVEHSYYPDFQQIILAHNLIDAGVDVILGHHSHTIQPIEMYKDRWIFYSLGNFCFSDIVFEDKTIHLDRKRHMESIIVKLYFEPDSIKYNLIAIKNKNNFIDSDTRVLAKLGLRNFLFRYFLKDERLLKLYHMVERRFYPIYRHFFGTSGNYWGKIRYMIVKLIK